MPIIIAAITAARPAAVALRASHVTPSGAHAAAEELPLRFVARTDAAARPADEHGRPALPPRSGSRICCVRLACSPSLVCRLFAPPRGSWYIVRRAACTGTTLAAGLAHTRHGAIGTARYGGTRRRRESDHRRWAISLMRRDGLIGHADIRSGITARWLKALVVHVTAHVTVRLWLIDGLRALARPLLAPPAVGRELTEHRHGVVVHNVSTSRPLVQRPHQGGRVCALTQPLASPEAHCLLSEICLCEQQRYGPQRCRLAPEEALQRVD